MFEDAHDDISLRSTILEVDPMLKAEFGPAFLNEELRKGNLSNDEIEYVNDELELYSLMSMAFTACKDRYLQLRGNKLAKIQVSHKLKCGAYDNEIKEAKDRYISKLSNDDEYMEKLQDAKMQQELETGVIISDEEIEQTIENTAYEYAVKEVTNLWAKKESETIFGSLGAPYIPRHMRAVYQKVVTSGSKNLAMLKWSLARITGAIMPEVKGGILRRFMNQQDDYDE